MSLDWERARGDMPTVHRQVPAGLQTERKGWKLNMLLNPAVAQSCCCTNQLRKDTRDLIISSINGENKTLMASLKSKVKYITSLYTHENKDRKTVHSPNLRYGIMVLSVARIRFISRLWQSHFHEAGSFSLFSLSLWFTIFISLLLYLSPHTLTHSAYTHPHSAQL